MSIFNFLHIFETLLSLLVSTPLRRFVANTTPGKTWKVNNFYFFYSKKKVRRCKLEVLRLAKKFIYPDVEDVKCDKNARFRTIDGTCNNLDHPRFGATMTKFIRLEPAAYGDCVSTPRRALSGDELPNARNVSRFVHGSNADRTNPDSPRLTHLTMNWGQFMDHDITLAQAQNISCEPPTSDPECIDIEVPLDDAIFQKRGVTFFELERDAPHNPQTSMCELSSREHTNTITAYIDASSVYGSSEEEEENLRAPGGLLRVMKDPHGYTLPALLPAQDPEISCVSKDPNRPCFVAGDERVNENQGKNSNHLHSSICRSVSIICRSASGIFRSASGMTVTMSFNPTLFQKSDLVPI